MRHTLAYQQKIRNEVYQRVIKLDWAIETHIGEIPKGGTYLFLGRQKSNDDAISAAKAMVKKNSRVNVIARINDDSLFLFILDGGLAYLRSTVIP